MPRVAIYYLELDDENVAHIARHGITADEVEQITGNPYITARNRRGPANRIVMIGRTNGGRELTIVLEATRDDGVWRPVTGWVATATERRLLDAN